MVNNFSLTSGGMTEGLCTAGYLDQFIDHKLSGYSIDTGCKAEASLSAPDHPFPYERLSDDWKQKETRFYRIEVRGEGEEPVYKTDFSTREAFQQFANDNLVSRREFSFITASCITARVDNIRNCVEDFFTPNFVYAASRFKDSRFGLAIAGAALTWDFLTFPIRILTLMPRLALEKWEGEHPLRGKLGPVNSETVCVRVQFLYSEKSRKDFTRGEIEFPLSLGHHRYEPIRPALGWRVESADKLQENAVRSF